MTDRIYYYARQLADRSQAAGHKIMSSLHVESKHTTTGSEKALHFLKFHVKREFFWYR